MLYIRIFEATLRNKMQSKKPSDEKGEENSKRGRKKPARFESGFATKAASMKTLSDYFSISIYPLLKWSTSSFQVAKWSLLTYEQLLSNLRTHILPAKNDPAEEEKAKKSIDSFSSWVGSTSSDKFVALKKSRRFAGLLGRDKDRKMRQGINFSGESESLSLSATF